MFTVHNGHIKQQKLRNILFLNSYLTIVNFQFFLFCCSSLVSCQLIWKINWGIYDIIMIIMPPLWSGWGKTLFFSQDSPSCCLNTQVESIVAMSYLLSSSALVWYCDAMQYLIYQEPSSALASPTKGMFRPTVETVVPVSEWGRMHGDLISENGTQ